MLERSVNQRWPSSNSARPDYRHQSSESGVLVLSQPTEQIPLERPVEDEEYSRPRLRKRGVPLWAWVLTGLCALTLVLVSIGISVMVGIRPASTAVPPAERTSTNTTACKFFEDGYNQVADAVRARVPEALVAAHDRLPSRIRDAENKAEGDVAVALRDIRELVPLMGSSDGAAFFMQAETVAQECKADGATIDLHKMK